ncbi:hypothetical protein EYF80_017361 [Liparis tanakae]|uniref:Uncharacterized protein n=1 Tax=Liparis tanakae TaxID=230148 RepID=A0A4Z2I4Q5_9TELE|nr:hypothetical protein EYF80_017361 [Liparis tanakae]
MSDAPEALVASQKVEGMERPFIWSHLKGGNAHSTKSGPAARLNRNRPPPHQNPPNPACAAEH